MKLLSIETDAKTSKNTKGNPAKKKATKKKTNKTKKVTPKKNKDESTIVLVYLCSLFTMIYAGK